MALQVHLCYTGYIKTQVENLRELGPGLISADVNEYATSKADLLIKNEKLVLNDKLKCVYISIDNHHCGAGYDCISTLPCVSGMVAELQIDNRTSRPVWKCSHNMSGVAASLTYWVLTRGVLVDLVTMFGLVTSMEHLECTKLLKVECDLKNGVCGFTGAKDYWILIYS